MSVLQECDGVGNAGVGSVGGVVEVSVYMGGTRGSGGLSSASDVLEMCVACVCVWLGAEWEVLG